VIKACAKPRRDHDGTWITGEMQNAYIQLHELGIAHSLEVWADDDLAGGIYGLALGKVFFGESMFSDTQDASKIALVALCHQLQQWKFTAMDCQVSNPHLLSMGAVEISREEFENHLQDTNCPDQWKPDFSHASHW